MEILTALGMASSAGLNAYVPLLVAGLLARHTDLLSLSAQWQWLQDPWTLGIVAALLAVELLADKIPAVDSLNDAVQTVVRPASGGVVFGAGATAAAPQAAAAEGTADTSVWLVVVGAAVALVVHTLKALGRLVANAATAGAGAPVLSTAEDAVSVLLSLAAVLVPVLVLVLVPLAVAGGLWLRRRSARRGRDATGTTA